MLLKRGLTLHTQQPGKALLRRGFLSKPLKEIREITKQTSRGRALHIQGIANAKALRQKHTWWTGRKPEANVAGVVQSIKGRVKGIQKKQRLISHSKELAFTLSEMGSHWRDFEPRNDNVISTLVASLQLLKDQVMRKTCQEVISVIQLR